MKGKKNCSRLILVSGLVLILSAAVLQAQNGTEDVRLFQSYFYDTPISERPYGEAGFSYSKFENWTLLGVGARGGYPVNEKLEIQGELLYLSWSPEEGDGESGISDLGIYGRYNISNNSPTNFAVGGLITLPIGSEDIGQGNLNFGGFGAVRHPLDNGMVITGNAGLMFYETTEVEVDPVTLEVEEKTKHENSFNIGAGIIYPTNDKMNIIGELSLQTEGDYMMLSGGVDYNLGNGRVRGMLGIGLDDGAPDLTISGSYAIPL